jgi:hypothetical protein
MKRPKETKQGIKHGDLTQTRVLEVILNQMVSVKSSIRRAGRVREESVKKPIGGFVVRFKYYLDLSQRLGRPF